MPVRKHEELNSPGAHGLSGGRVADPQSRAKFTSAIVTALKELQLQSKKPSNAKELGQRAYQKLQYDLPLVSPDELEGLAGTLRASLRLKSGQPLFPITAKLLENVVAGARAPVSTAPAAPSGPWQNAPSTTASAPIPAGAGPDSEPGPASSSGTGGSGDAPAAAATQITESGGARDAGAEGLTGPASEPLSSSLIDIAVLKPDQQRLCGAFRALCAVIFVQLVSHSLAVSEQDTWGLLHAIGLVQEEEEEEDAEEAEVDEQRAESAARPPGAEEQSVEEASTSIGGSASATNPVITAGQGRMHHEENGNGPAQGDAALGPQSLSFAINGGARHTQHEEQQPERSRIYDEPHAAEEDGDDFVFEELEAPCSTSSGAAVTPAAGASAGVGALALGASPPPSLPPPYSWPALRARLLRLAGHVSYALLDEPELWSDGKLIQGVFQLLRALGAHRHAQELQPLLHAYVGLVADRIAAEPSELECLDSLWDAVGLQCVASLPQVGRQRGAGSGPGGERNQGPLLVETTTCLSLVATLSGQLTGAAAKLRLWQQVHKHMLPLLERCLSELARMVGPGRAAGKTAAQQQTQQQQAQVQPKAEPKSPGPEEVAAIVLVCQVLDFYVQQRPGNADLAASLKGTGVLASLSVLFAAAGALPGAEPLRSAALCCAASSRELHTWMLAVPGVSKTLAGPNFQEDGSCEAHGAVWELLGNNGSSPLALSILAGGAAPEKAVRVHALLQLLARATACRGGGRGGGSLWGPAVERAMRELFAALRQEQAAGSGSAAGRAAEGEGLNRGASQQNGATSGEAPGSAWAAAGGLVGAEGVSGALEGLGENGEVTVGPASGDAEDEEDDDKLHLLDPAALQRRRARQLHPACWRILKQLLTVDGESRGKTD